VKATLGMKEVELGYRLLSHSRTSLPPQIPPQQKNHVRKENPSSEAMCKQQNLRGRKLIENTIIIINSFDN